MLLLKDYVGKMPALQGKSPQEVKDFILNEYRSGSITRQRHGISPL